MPRNGESPNKVIAANVKALREKRELSQRELASKVGIDPKNVSNIERGAHDNPSLTNLAAIAGYFGIEIWRLMRPGAERAAPADDDAEKLLSLYEKAAAKNRTSIMQVAEMAAGYAAENNGTEQQQARTEGPASEVDRASLHPVSKGSAKGRRRA